MAVVGGMAEEGVALAVAVTGAKAVVGEGEGWAEVAWVEAGREVETGVGWVGAAAAGWAAVGMVEEVVAGVMGEEGRLRTHPCSHTHTPYCHTVRPRPIIQRSMLAADLPGALGSSHPVKGE